MDTIICAIAITMSMRKRLCLFCKNDQGVWFGVGVPVNGGGGVGGFGGGGGIVGGVGGVGGWGGLPVNALRGCCDTHGAASLINQGE